MASVPPGLHVSSQYYPLYYTFGVEFEFIIKFRFADYGIQPDPEKQTYGVGPVHEHVIEVLRQAGFEVNDYETGTPELGFWTVKLDDSIKPKLPANSEFGYAPVEITTPVLRFARASTFNSFWEIHRMLTAVTRRFYIFVNETCGLHVHVGAITDPRTQDYKYSRGFPLKTIRNLCQLLTLCEPELNAIHPPSRLHNGYGALPSQLLAYKGNAAEVLDRCTNFTALNWVWMGMKLEDHDEPTPLTYLETDDSYVPAYHLGYLIRESDHYPEERSRRTIEFRQHIGTMWFDEVYHWVKTVVRLLQFSHECGPKGLPESLISTINEERATRSGRFNTVSFLTAIGAAEQARFYQQGRLHTHPSPEIPQLYYRAPEEPPQEAWPLMEIWPEGPYADGGENEVPDLQTMNYPDLTYRDVEY
ncbi:hypothetical protein T310_2377 [Rasamsonia emersonii CBS 393.64]|uniref:Amidoligase enzyme n=1 Tax=Rasamsonia emersonii (strain ATCC 16479 / CBS 393.64 / IMI 116815) TaxID=1408163 RepID=A0A0F4YZQ3_RASE3|nr:hypothetical protein T310_2377 [Rasamsonia emersonii CBS 393.64]KKA23595.1 hypothetical protein T310_2377 [Rasamsonia emersonii CBS 393.64]